MPSFALYCATPGNQGPTNSTEGGDIGVAGKMQYHQPSNGTVNIGSTNISLNNASGLDSGDMVLIMQMQGADINSTQSNAYGDGNSGVPAAGWLNNSNFTAGHYEYAKVSSRSGNTINFEQGLVNRYVQANATSSTGKRRYQVIRVPQYTNLTLVSNLTAKAWDGDTGGVLVLDVANTLNMDGYTINMNIKGFRGGGGLHQTGTSGLTNTDYRVQSSNNVRYAHASKGEGFAGTPRYIWDSSSHSRTSTGLSEGYPNGSYARGAPANAGGGATDGNPIANDQNAGGGGGGNGGAGGQGGNSWSTNEPTGGFGGAAFPAAANRIVMGGGGGAGTMNNYAPGESQVYPHGGAGGGIVLIRAGKITGNGTIQANGGTGPSPRNDGAGGGGAGGTVIVVANSHTGGLQIEAKGGDGATVDFGDPHGPGGGGGGGVVFTNGAISAMIDTRQGESGMAGNGSSQWPYQYYGASPSGGVSGSTVPNISPGDIEGADPGANCWTAQTDLSIEKTRHSGSMQAGGIANFLITVSNHGPDDTIAPIEVKDVLDSRFTYTGFSGLGWSCSAAGQTVSCIHSGVLHDQASSELIIETQIAAVATRQSIINTASVALEVGHNNSDPNSNNNSASLDDTIYGATESGNKWLYLYPTSTTAGTISRSVPDTVSRQDMGTGLSSNRRMTLALNPSLADSLAISAEDILVKVCMRPSSTANQRLRQVRASLYYGTTQIGTSATVAFSNHNYLYYIFALELNTGLTVNSGQALSLRLENESGNTSDTVSISNNANGSDCYGQPPSHVEIETSTVINVGSVKVYNQAYPAGEEVSRVQEGSTVYVRSVVTDPFGHADINNNSTVDVMDGTSILAGGFTQTNVISASGNSKEFEYAVSLPTVPNLGEYILRVTANEGTEGMIRHRAAADIELTSDPALSVEKQADKVEVAPGEEIEYTLKINNSTLSTVGDAHQIVVIDTLPEFTSLKLAAPIVIFTDGATPYNNSNMNIDSIEYSDDEGATWGYIPVSEAGGAAVGYDALVQQMRIKFNGSMAPNTGFSLQYTLRLD